VADQLLKVYEPLPLHQENDLEEQIRDNMMLTSMDQLMNWARRSSLWPAMFGLACCAMEMIATVSPRYDLARFGAEIFRASPRQADLLIVPGTVTWKMAPAVRRIWLQMPEPKWAIAMGGCATMGGPFAYAYSVTPGVNTLLPVDVYVPGCPPRPESLLTGFMLLQDKIKQDTTMANGWKRRDVLPQFDRYLPDGDPIRAELEKLWPPYLDYDTPPTGEAFAT
jgi:NADH-quinone oxidoreductase subunit B